jgi:hypothetical protein
LRHSDYERLFADFRVLRDDCIVPESDAAALGATALSKDFRRYSTRDLLALNGLFVLALPAAPSERS